MACLSIGLPVYNGEVYLEAALVSLLGQTFGDFELIISDNASTDSTEEICRSYAANDSRIQYFRAERNRGAAWNFNRVVKLAGGEYFKWAAYDDLHEPLCLEMCVKAIRNHPDAVLSYTRSRLIDEEGRHIRDYNIDFRTHSRLPHKRFYDLISRDYLACQLYGVIRTASLRRTSLLGSYPSADIHLLAELALMGPFHEINRPYFLRRDHARRSVRAYTTVKETAEWFNPGAVVHARMAKVNRFLKYASAIRRARLDAREKMLCYLALVRCIGVRMPKAVKGYQVGIIGSLKSSLRKA